MKNRTSEELVERTRGLAALLDVSQRLSATLDVDEVLQAAVEGATQVVELDTAAVYLLDGDTIRLGATVPPLPVGFPEPLRVAALDGHPHIRSTIDSREPVLVADFLNADLSDEERFVAKQRDIRAALFVPLVVEGQAIGAFIVGSTREPLSISEAAIDLSRTLANLSALAVKNAQLFEEGQKYAAQLQQALAERIHGEGERKKLHVQLAQAQKMESIGRLAGGVAHDFNNMLSVILGHASLALDGIDVDNPLRNHLTEISLAAERSADLTGQLLAFARKQTVAPRNLDLNQVVGDMLKMLRRLLGEAIDLKWLPGEDIGLVRVNPAQVDQVMANLCVNARDAIAGGGKITIETSGVTLDESYCASYPGSLPGDYVLLAVSDDGAGMSEAVLPHVFEPFFSTKEAGKGTGLGLSMVYGVVMQNGGFINVDSELGKGTTFSIYFRRRDAEGPDSPVCRDETAVGGDETLLFVEDEEMILRMGVRMLESLGYRVFSAPSAAAALDLVERSGVSIDLLVTDVVMPKMNGRELAAELNRRFPELRTLFISGYTANVIAHHGILEDGIDFLSKPFSRSDLAIGVRQALYRSS